MPKRYPRVPIAGGGIGGLAAALALLKRGIDVDVSRRSCIAWLRICAASRTAPRPSRPARRNTWIANGPRSG
jgi:flavin-dependent dehydrogenase